MASLDRELLWQAQGVQAHCGCDVRGRWPVVQRLQKVADPVAPGAAHHAPGAGRFCRLHRHAGGRVRGGRVPDGGRFAHHQRDLFLPRTQALRPAAARAAQLCQQGRALDLERGVLVWRRGLQHRGAHGRVGGDVNEEVRMRARRISTRWRPASASCASTPGSSKSPTRTSTHLRRPSRTTCALRCRWSTA